ncbi:MAG: beta-ketoacyl synthase N-terminal-like domain-containing protein [Bacteroidota bacterium]
MAYINGIGIISPQNTLPGSEFLEPVVEHHSDFLKSVEPVYRTYIDPIASRRLSRLIKMGISAAKICLQDAGDGMQDAGCKMQDAGCKMQDAGYKMQDAGYKMQDAGCKMPDAIITGTGLGSVEDTEKILGELTIEEKFLNPTPFIQSTYNTISSQIAIHLKCHQYNSTYVHRCFSLESCLIDALLQIADGSSVNVLAGGIDEMTLNHLTIIRRLGLWKPEPISNLGLWESQVPGALPGEGAAYFLISGAKTEKTYARLEAVETLYKPASNSETADFIIRFLDENKLSSHDIDLVLMGNNGDASHDAVCNDVMAEALPQSAKVRYKHLCGEFHTVSGFAMYTGANILKRQKLPASLKVLPLAPEKLNNILIHNHFMNTDHSFILLRR